MAARREYVACPAASCPGEDAEVTFHEERDYRRTPLLILDGLACPDCGRATPAEFTDDEAQAALDEARGF